MNIPTETLIEKRDQMAKKDPLAHCDVTVAFFVTLADELIAHRLSVGQASERTGGGASAKPDRADG